MLPDKIIIGVCELAECDKEFVILGNLPWNKRFCCRKHQGRDWERRSGRNRTKARQEYNKPYTKRLWLEKGEEYNANRKKGE